MNPLEEARKKYESIPVSEKLAGTVEESIRSALCKNSGSAVRKRKPAMIYRWGTGAAAGLLAGFIFLVNVNTAFAAQLQQIPVIGAFVRLVTIRSYEESTEDYGISLKVPGLRQIAEEHSDFTEAVNREISDMCSQYAEEAKQRAMEYRQAFLDTGGTEEEWKEHEIQITVDYEIKSQSESSLSFTVTGTESWVSAYAETRYYNLDLENLRYISLEDLLGENYIDIINSNIRKQIKERSQSGDETFFTAEEGGFQGIHTNQKFYINRKGNPVIVFDKYTIAPGYMGNVEFEIQ